MSTAVDVFCELLRARLTLAQHDDPDLARLAPAFRCDHLLLRGADLGDALAGYAAGRVGSGAIREGALAVCAAAYAVYVATVEEGTVHGR